MLYLHSFYNYCYLVHPNGMLDSVYMNTNSYFVGVPFNYTMNFFIDNLNIHRNALSYITIKQSQLFL